MTLQLKPWAYGPFEILLHAEKHYLAGEDIDRRLSMVGFDNAIELAITTYLNLHPIQRAGRTYKNEDVEKWSSNYHTKAEFFFLECKSRGVVPNAKQDEVVWFHGVRNGQYHGGGTNVPDQRVLSGVRAVALEVFSILFDEKDASLLLEEHIAMMSSSSSPPRTDAQDRLIDHAHDMIEVCGRVEYPSEVIYALDPYRYREVALELEASVDSPNEEGEGEFE
jgi:hypothetical protein